MGEGGGYENNTDLSYTVSDSCHVWVRAISLIFPWCLTTVQVRIPNRAEVFEHLSIYQTDFSKSWKQQKFI